MSTEYSNWSNSPNNISATGSLASPEKQKQKPGNSNGGWSLLSSLLPTAISGGVVPASQLSPTSSMSSASINSGENEFTLDSCKCCGKLIKYPSNVQKYSCAFCHTNFITSNYDHHTPCHALRQKCNNIESVSFVSIKKIADSCYNLFQQVPNESKSQAQAKFAPLEEYLYRAFSDWQCLNNSFILGDASPKATAPNVDFKQIQETYKLLLSLPIKRPFFVLLTAANKVLHNPPPLDSPNNLNWLFVLLELPTLSSSLYFNKPTSPIIPGARVPPHVLFFEAKEVKTISYKIIEKIIGFVSNLDHKCIQETIIWMSKFLDAEFKRKVELINLFVTFHLRIIINKSQSSNNSPNNDTNNVNKTLPNLRRAVSNSVSPELPHDKCVNSTPPRTSPDFRSLTLMQLTNGWPNSKKRSKKSGKIKLKLNLYGYDWHLKAAARFLSFLNQAKLLSNSKITCNNSIFYNSLVDFINVKQDFDAWQNLTGKRSTTKTELTVNDMSLSVNDYLTSAVSAPLLPAGITSTKPMFTFCQFPFILSLASKISILEYEAKRQMEKKAEEAFIHAINRKTIVEVYFKVRVRRNEITNDSLRSIKENRRELKKSLKVEFIGEPGIDAGGLKKEWFLLLTKKLTNPDCGLFYNIPESNYLWFSLGLDSSESSELYYLVGVILGLAVYNSTILELKFPPCLYKILVNESVGFEDFKQIYPDTGANLMKLVEYNCSDFEQVFGDMNFEINYKDVYGEVLSAELITGGSNVPVTSKNKSKYIRKYSQFYLNTGIKAKITSFKQGFENVINGNAFSLFNSQEIELILCGSDEGAAKYDLDALKSVTKYTGFTDNGAAAKVPVIQWFWNYFSSLDIVDQKKLMLFITGSDRIPATGIISMHFKLTLFAGDSDRLPVAHTCFNELCLYRYPTEEKLVSKLTVAMNESQGFGIK